MYPDLLINLANGYIADRSIGYAVHDALAERGHREAAGVFANCSCLAISGQKLTNRNEQLALALAQELAGHTGPWWHTSGQIAVPPWDAIKELRQAYQLTGGYWRDVSGEMAAYLMSGYGSFTIRSGYFGGMPVCLGSGYLSGGIPIYQMSGYPSIPFFGAS